MKIEQRIYKLIRCYEKINCCQASFDKVFGSWWLGLSTAFVAEEVKKYNCRELERHGDFFEFENLKDLEEFLLCYLEEHNFSNS